VAGKCEHPPGYISGDHLGTRHKVKSLGCPRLFTLVGVTGLEPATLSQPEAVRVFLAWPSEKHISSEHLKTRPIDNQNGQGERT
jgi:hypothetical protein